MNKDIMLKIKVDILDGEINIHVDKSGSINYISDDNKTNIIRKRVDPIYVPQFGDIIHLGEAYPFIGERLGIFNKCDKDYYDIIFSIFLDTNEVEYNNWSANERPIRLATEEECEVVFKKLEELGKKWNPTTKLIEDIYVPQNGDFVFFKSKTSTQFEDVSIFNKKVGDKYYTYFSVYKEDNKVYNHIDDTRVHICEHQILELRRANPEEIKFLLDKLKEENLSWDAETKTLSKIVEFEPKAGDLICVETKNYSDQVYVCKFNDLNTHTIFVDYTFSIKTSNLYEFKDKWVKSQFILRKPTSKELELFYNKLKEESLELDFENNLVEKPKVGDLCIFWDDNKEVACIAILKSMCEKFYYRESWGYKHCIKFKSKEQFKKLINEKV